MFYTQFCGNFTDITGTVFFQMAERVYFLKIESEFCNFIPFVVINCLEKMEEEFVLFHLCS